MHNGIEPEGERKPLAASTIRFMLGIVRQVRASAVDEHGNEIYPYTWNNKYIKAPKVRKKDMKRPSITPDVMTGLAMIANVFYRVLFILLGATGARIGEMLAVEIDKHISADFRTISIRQKVREGNVEPRLKTEASSREVDLHPAISELLKWFVGDRKSGFLFPGKWADRPTVYRAVSRHLHKELKKLGYDNDYDHSSKAGTHVFRRFRITYLRNVVSCPEGVRHFWLGHAKDGERDDRADGDEMGAWYDTIGKNRPFRLQKAEECGFGFNLPSDVPNAPKFPTRKRPPRNSRKRQSNQTDK